MKHHTKPLNMFRSSILFIAVMTLVSASLNKTEQVKTPLIIQEFFDFQKEVEDFIPSVKDLVDTTTVVPTSTTTESLVYLEPGILAERDYDFYEDDPIESKEDSEAAGSSDMTVRAGFYPQFANKRNSDYDDYEYDVEERDYGHSSHSSGGYSDHGGSSGGYSDHGGGYHDSGYKVQPKKPGPYGYATPNFKCEKSSETLYVTETEWTFDKKCFNVYKVQCTEGYDEGKDIGYQKHCNEFTVTKCRTAYDTSSEERCWTVYKKQCDMVYETVVDWEYKQKCTTSYEEECHGYGYHQECESVPKEHCKQVPKKVEKQVPRTKCKKVPDKRCQDFPINVPRKECKEFPKTVCTQDPINVKKKIPKKTCVQIPREVCNKIPRQIIKEVPKKVGKKVCTSTKPSYGHSGSSYEEPSYSAPSSGYSAPSNSYSAPAPSYSAPAPSYNAPAPSYSAPQDDYGSPHAPAYSASSEYGTPAASAYGYKRSAHRRNHKSAQVAQSDHWGLGPGK